MDVFKKDLKKAEFNINKTKVDILKAFKKVDLDFDYFEIVDSIINFVQTKINKKSKLRNDITSEEIKDLVELALMQAGEYEVAKVFLNESGS